LEQPIDIHEPPFTTGHFSRYEAIKRRVESTEGRIELSLSMNDVGEMIAEFANSPEPNVNSVGADMDESSGNGVLTAREREIVGLIAKGRSNQEIADELFISHRTAQTHVSNVLCKPDLSSRAAIAAYAVRHGLG
jgi:DNA-binding NarL/FixJ family response regulator